MIQPSRHLRLTATLIALGVLAVAAGCRRAAAPVQPAHVVSGSMAERFWGQHWRVTCGDCGYSFRCGVEHPPAGNKAICPNCGYAQNEIDEDDVQPGQAVEVVPRDFHRDPPRRYEVIAFHEPGSDHVAVKRVIGLPGERVAIRGGDVFVDGRRLQKSLAEFNDVELPLYHPSYFPKLTPLPARWRPADAGSFWESYVFVEAPHWQFHCDRLSRSIVEFDWLNYHHRSTAGTPTPRTADARILDGYAYNQGLSRSLNAVGDVLLVAGVKMTDGGELHIRLTGGERPLMIGLVPQENTVTLWHGEEKLADAPTSTPLAGGSSWNLKAGIIDGRVLVEIEDQLTLALDLETISPPPELGDVALAFGNRRLNVEVSLPMIFRDIYYLNPQQGPDDWEMESALGDGEFFLMGDNPPNSHDSRHYGGVKQSALVGSVRRLVD